MRHIIYGLMLIFLTACGKNEQHEVTTSSVTPAADDVFRVKPPAYKAAASTPAPVASMPTPVVKEDVKDAEFDFTPEQFASLFNAASQSYEQRFRIGKVKIKDGDVNNIFRYDFSGRISFMAGVSKKTGRIVNMSTVMGGDGNSKQQGLDMMVMSMILTKATNPNLTNSEISEMVLGMIKEAPSLTADKKGVLEQPERTINNIRYILELGHGIGYWWVIEPIV